MSMQRPFIQLIFALVASFALLGGCASDGTSGASGSSGSDGTDGTIALPDADTLTITATQDNHTSVGTITFVHTVVGLDNDSADARERYYMYEGTSSTAKSGYWKPSTTPAGTYDTSPFTDGELDTRMTTLDNITLTTVSQTLGTSDGSITHLIICRGNAAGDATTCSASALKDRGVGTAATVVSTSDTVAFLVVPYGTSAFVSIRDNDTVVHAYNITDTKNTEVPAYGSTIAITTGSSGARIHDTVTGKIYGGVVAGAPSAGKICDQGWYHGGSLTCTTTGTGHMVDAIESNGTVYYATVSSGATADNKSAAVYSYSSSDNETASTLLDNISMDGDGPGNHLVLAGTDESSNDSIFIVANNKTDNYSLTPYKLTTAGAIRWGTDNLTMAGDAAGSATNDLDNATKTVSTAFCADARQIQSSSDNATLFIGHIDNGTKWSIDSLSGPGGTWGTPAITTSDAGWAPDNITAHMCDMVVTKGTASDWNGTLYMAVRNTQDNVTVFKVTSLGDLALANMSKVGSFIVSDNVTSLKIGHDSDDNSTVIVVNDFGNIELWRNFETTLGGPGTADNFTHIISADSTGVTGDRVSLAVQPSKYAIGYMDSSNDAAIKIWYNE